MSKFTMTIAVAVYLTIGLIFLPTGHISLLTGPLWVVYALMLRLAYKQVSELYALEQEVEHLRTDIVEIDGELAHLDHLIEKSEKADPALKIDDVKENKT